MANAFTISLDLVSLLDHTPEHLNKDNRKQKVDFIFQKTEFHKKNNIYIDKLIL